MFDDPRQINIADFPAKAKFAEQIRFILNYAVLAPSTHNSQPWLFNIEGPACKIYYDPSLILPEADPESRDLHISIGCAIENLVLAAKYFNIFRSIRYNRLKNTNLLAVVRFKQYKGAVNNKYKTVLETIAKRVNARGLFSAESIPPATLNSISSRTHSYLVDGVKVHWITKQDKILELSRITANGLKVAYRKPAFRREMAQWLRHSLTKRKDGLPGYALKMPLLLSFILPSLIRRFNLGGLLAKLNYRSLSSAPLLTVITASKNTPGTWLNVGRLAERLMLEFNSLNWQTSIFVAAVEMGDFYREVQKVIRTKQRPQFIFAIGKVNSLQRPTPRHGLAKKIIP